MYTQLQERKAQRKTNSTGDIFLLRVEVYLKGLLERLDAVLDKRLVRTFFDVFVAIIRHRSRSTGLILSELGAFVLSPRRCCAGTKRISNLLRSPKWTHDIIGDFLLGKAVKQAGHLTQQNEQGLLLWDDSVVEKPESWFSQGLCAVSSSKAKRLIHIKPGYYSPPRVRISVPGFEWSACMLCTLKQIPSVVKMRWWTTRGLHHSDRKTQFIQMLKEVVKAFTQPLIHVLDRGYADASIITRLIAYQQQFILRWPKKFNLRGSDGKSKNTYKLSIGHKHFATKVIYDAPRDCWRRITMLYLPVTLPLYAQFPLYLVICRHSKHGQEPLYLLTNCSIHSHADAWKIIFSYLRRWRIEQAFRFNKSELALESPRLWFWQNRLKLMGIVALIYDFLLSIMRNWTAFANLWMNAYCPRTGKRHSEAQVPLYRLRIALAFLLANYFLQNSG